MVEALGGLAVDDPRLLELLRELGDIVQKPTSQLARLEAALVVLAQHLEPHLLPSALAQLVDALLPNELEQRAEDGHSARGFGLRLREDGSGWLITDRDLDLECGDLLQTVLAAELAVDPDAPADTVDVERLRPDGWQDGDPLPESVSPSASTCSPSSLARCLRSRPPRGRACRPASCAGGPVTARSPASSSASAAA